MSLCETQRIYFVIQHETCWPRVFHGPLGVLQALLSLADRLGEAKPHGMPKSRIEQLASYRYKPGTHKSDQPM